MPVVVLTRELGTQSESVADSLSQALGCRLHLCDPDETPDSAPAPLPVCRHPTDLVDALAHRRDVPGLGYINQLMRIALAGNAIIVSNVAAHLFATFPGVLRTRVRATMALRVKCLAPAGGDPEAALLQILASDLRMRERLRRWFGGIDPEEAALYDLVVDTGRTSTQACALTILTHLQEKVLPVDLDTHLAMTRLAARVTGHLRGARAPAADAQPGEAAAPASNVYPFPSTRAAETPLSHPVGRR